MMNVQVLNMVRAFTASGDTRVMDAIEREAARQGHETVVLEASIPAKAFYLHRGYSVTGTERWGIETTERHPSATL